MNAAGISALGLVHFEKVTHLFENQVERTGLVSCGRRDRVSVHRIAGPQHDPSFALHRANEWRQELADIFSAETTDQRQPASFVLRIKYIDQPQKIVGFQGRTALQSDWIFDPARIFDVRMIMLTRSITDPKHVTRRRVPIASR